jgi:hypothetical protein
MFHLTAVSSSDHIAPNGGIISEYETGENVEEAWFVFLLYLLVFRVFCGLILLFLAR